MSVPMPIPDAVTIGLREIEQARAEEHVAGRAEGDPGACLGHSRQRPVAHMDAMGEDRARPDQAEPVVDVEIVGGLREPARDEFDLARIFGEVGVHQHVGMGGDQRSGVGELLGAGGRHEARRHCIAEPAAAAPSRDQSLGVGAAGGDAVAQALRPKVHQHLARDDPHVALSAASNKASTEPGWTVAKTSALVVPWRSSSSRKKAATESAWARSAKAFSAGKIWRSSHCMSCSPCEAMHSICG
jgi:hypothetical protein